MTKYCQNCRFYQLGENADLDVCLRKPKVSAAHLVRKGATQHRFCSLEREIGDCGESGKYWEGR